MYISSAYWYLNAVHSYSNSIAISLCEINHLKFIDSGKRVKFQSLTALCGNMTNDCVEMHEQHLVME